MKKQTVILITAALAGAFALTGCGGDTPASSAPATTSAPATSAPATNASATPASGKLNRIADGPDVCIKKMQELLDGDTQVMNIDAAFYTDPAASGPTAEPTEGLTPGDLVSCSITYRDPDDDKMVLTQAYNVNTDKLLDPMSQEVQGIGGGDLDLADYVVPLSSIDGAGLQATMDAQTDALDKAYSAYDWQNINVSEPGMASDKNYFELMLMGVSNGETSPTYGTLYVELDGKTIIQDALVA